MQSKRFLDENCTYQLGYKKTFDELLKPLDGIEDFLKLEEGRSLVGLLWGWKSLGLKNVQSDDMFRKQEQER